MRACGPMSTAHLPCLHSFSRNRNCRRPVAAGARNLHPRRLLPPSAPAPQDHLNDFMWHLLHKAQKHPDAGPFLAPVSAEDVPDYYTIIIVSCRLVAPGCLVLPTRPPFPASIPKTPFSSPLVRPGPAPPLPSPPPDHPPPHFSPPPVPLPGQDPMDLGTMEERLRSRRYYITLNMFAADLYKMVKNCQVRRCQRSWAHRPALNRLLAANDAPPAAQASRAQPPKGGAGSCLTALPSLRAADLLPDSSSSQP